MSSFLRRLKYYGIGFAIGLIFVVVIFQQKGCSWTPSNRVKSAVLDRIIFVDSLDSLYLAQHRISPIQLKEFIEGASISFSDSQREGNEKIYVFYNAFPQQENINCLIALREKSFVVDIDFENSDIHSYRRLKGKARPFLFKKDKNWFSGSWENFTLKGIDAQKAPEIMTELFFKTGILYADSSNLNADKPLHKISITNTLSPSKKAQIRFTGSWYQEKIEIEQLSSDN